jgi:hypothetical protein
MKNIGLFIITLFAIGLTSCLDYKTPQPSLESFAVHEIVRTNGILTAGAVVTSPKAGVTYRLQATTQADLGVFWTGDFRYRPLTNNVTPAVKDSVLDSRNYALHYGKVGAQGLTTNSMPGRKGWFRDFAWPREGNYDVVIVLTNHAADGPDFLQKNFDFKVSVVK